MPQDIKLELHYAAELTAVKLNDQWIPVQSVNIDFKKGETPIVAVELEVPYADIAGEGVHVYLHPATVALLKAAGWTPPTEKDAL